jgi:hypothetical protein
MAVALCCKTCAATTQDDTDAVYAMQMTSNCVSFRIRNLFVKRFSRTERRERSQTFQNI